MTFEDWEKQLNRDRYPGIPGALPWVEIVKILKEAWLDGYSEGYENGFTDGDQDTYNPTGGINEA